MPPTHHALHPSNTASSLRLPPATSHPTATTLQMMSGLIDTKVSAVRTKSGPGGLSGPLRVDLQGRHCPNPMKVGGDSSEGDVENAMEQGGKLFLAQQAAWGLAEVPVVCCRGGAWTRRGAHAGRPANQYPAQLPCPAHPPPHLHLTPSLQEYTLAEAEQGFARTAASHGWVGAAQTGGRKPAKAKSAGHVPAMPPKPAAHIPAAAPSASPGSQGRGSAGAGAGPSGVGSLRPVIGAQQAQASPSGAGAAAAGQCHSFQRGDRCASQAECVPFAEMLCMQLGCMGQCVVSQLSGARAR